VIKPLVVAFPRMMRSIPLLPLTAIVLLAAAPTVLTVARHGDDLGLALVVAAVVGGAGLAYGVDDDAAALLAASPTTLAERRAARIGAAALVVSLGWLVVLAVAWGAGLLEGAPLGALAVEALTAAGLAVAVAAGLGRTALGEHSGMVGALAAVVVMLLITALAVRYTWLPALGFHRNHDEWLGLAAAAWVAVWWKAKDPANRRW
jgi:hypothetical protein